MKLLHLAFLSTLLSSASLSFAIEGFERDRVKLVVEGYDFTEGPTIIADGDLLFTAPRDNKVVRYSIPEGESSVFYEGEIGPSALFFREGVLFATHGGAKQVARFNKDGELEALAEEYKGNPFNKPNDLWVSPLGIVYFTDPNYGRQPMTQDGEFAYRVSKEGKVERIDAVFQRPNGIVGSEDGKTLFITDAGASKTYRFELGEDGTPGKQVLFAEIGGDGMTLDHKGNLFLTVPRQKAIVVLNPDGKEIARISDFGCTNCCFGPEGRILYITKGPGLYALPLY